MTRVVTRKLYKYLNLALKNECPSPQVGIVTVPSLSPVLVAAPRSGLTASVPYHSAVQCHRGAGVVTLPMVAQYPAQGNLAHAQTVCTRLSFLLPHTRAWERG